MDALRFFVLGFLSGLLVLSIAILATPARGHEAPSGWPYPSECCSGHDCYPISGDEIEATPVGWLIKATNELIEYNDPKVKPSGDAQYRRCSAQGKRDGRTICLFIPAGA